MVRRNDRMSLTRFAYVLLMLSSIPSLLFGAITVTYTAVPLELKTAPGPYTSNTVIGIKLGTLRVDGGPIYTPVWGNTTEVDSGTVKVKGPMSNGSNEATFYLMSVAYPNGESQSPTIKVFSGAFLSIVSLPQNWVTVSADPFIVELWLVNTADTNNTYNPSTTCSASDFQMNAAYTLDSFRPEFSFVTANSSKTNANSMMQGQTGNANPSNGTYAIVNGNGGPDSTPIVESTAYTDPDNPNSPVMTYVDPSQIVSYSVFLSEQTKTFNLSEAVGTNRKDVNTMTITVSNGIAGADYSQKVIFTDLTPVSTSAEFRMLPEESGPNPIPFKLYFDSTEVVKGEAITWNNLQNGSSNTKTIRIGGINQNTIDSLASGTYSDTISVEIQNP